MPASDLTATAVQELDDAATARSLTDDQFHARVLAAARALDRAYPDGNVPSGAVALALHMSDLTEGRAEDGELLNSLIALIGQTRDLARLIKRLSPRQLTHLEEACPFPGTCGDTLIELETWLSTAADLIREDLTLGLAG